MSAAETTIADALRAAADMRQRAERLGPKVREMDAAQREYFDAVKGTAALLIDAAWPALREVARWQPFGPATLGKWVGSTIHLVPDDVPHFEVYTVGTLAPRQVIGADACGAVLERGAIEEVIEAIETLLASTEEETSECDLEEYRSWASDVRALKAQLSSGTVKS